MAISLGLSVLALFYFSPLLHFNIFGKVTLNCRALYELLYILRVNGTFKLPNTGRFLSKTVINSEICQQFFYAIFKNLIYFFTV